jgi:hypothetical protein
MCRHLVWHKFEAVSGEPAFWIYRIDVMKVEAASSSAATLNFYQMTRINFAEDGITELTEFLQCFDH